MLFKRTPVFCTRLLERIKTERLAKRKAEGKIKRR